jgi:hypothetical protein
MRKIKAGSPSLKRSWEKLFSKKSSIRKSANRIASPVKKTSAKKVYFYFSCYLIPP